jgi:LacI family transcriptional regulator
VSRCQNPVVAVGGSYHDQSTNPDRIPYVATDNIKLIKIARDHLIEVGLHRFALFSLPVAEENRWAQEREHAFRSLMMEDQMDAQIFRGCETKASSWDEALQEQIAWLRSLPKPIGIIAVTDARARQLLQACASAGIAVPDQVALIGIDNDPMVRMLTPVPLSSVIQGAHEIGRTAAHLLDQMLHGARLAGIRIPVPPAGINALASSQHQPVKHPHVMRARHFIRQFACQGIRTNQVAERVGVSRSSIEALFRQELGCSVHDEILRFKLDAAMAGLDSRERSIADVALDSGFLTPQYMHMVFKRELGCTPRAYRDRSSGEVASAADAEGDDVKWAAIL